MSQIIIEMKLNKLNMNKASGVDIIHQSLRRELSEQLSGPLVSYLGGHLMKECYLRIAE